MKIEAGNDEYFLVDSIPRQRGTYEIFKNTTRVGLKRPDGSFLLVDMLDTFTNASDGSFATIQIWVDYVKTFIFIKGRV